MTIETVEAGLRHWLARARESGWELHAAACREKAKRLGVRLGLMVQDKPMPPDPPLVDWDKVRESIRDAGRVDIPVHLEDSYCAVDPFEAVLDEEPPDGEEADPEEIERVAQLAGEQGRAGAQDLLEKLTAHHEHEVALEFEVLRRECQSRTFEEHPNVNLGPRLDFILELIARLRVHDPLQLVEEIDAAAEAEEQAEELTEKVKAEDKPPMDPILAFLIYMEDWLDAEAGAPLDIDEAKTLLAAAQEKIHGSLLDQLKEHEAELEEQLADMEAQRNSALRSGGIANSDLNRCGLEKEALEARLEEQLEPKGCPEKDRDVETPYPGLYEAGNELNRLASELVGYAHELRPDESVVDMAIRLLRTWGSKPKGDETFDTFELTEAALDLLQATAKEHGLRNGAGFTNNRVARVYFALRALDVEIFEGEGGRANLISAEQVPVFESRAARAAAYGESPLVDVVRSMIRGTHPTHMVLDDVTEPERPSGVRTAQEQAEYELFWPDTERIPPIRGTRQTQRTEPRPVEDTMPLDHVERLMGSPLRKVEPYPDPRRHDKFAATGVERCPVEPEAEPMEIPNTAEALGAQVFNEIGPDGPAVGPEKAEYTRKEPDVHERLGARIFQNEPPPISDELAERLAEAKDAWLGKCPNRCEQVERLNSRAIRDEAGRVYVRHLTVGDPPLADPIAAPMDRLGNLLEILELGIRSPEGIVYAPGFLLNNIGKARKELDQLGDVLRR